MKIVCCSVTCRGFHVSISLPFHLAWSYEQNKMGHVFFAGLSLWQGPRWSAQNCTALLETTHTAFFFLIGVARLAYRPNQIYGQQDEYTPPNSRSVPETSPLYFYRKR
jgi:hypothetical protein